MFMKKLIGLCVVLILVASCNINKVSSSLYNMQGNQVCFDGLTPSLFGKDLTDGRYKIPSKNARLVVYFDSTVCQSCRLNKLYEWEPILNLEQKMNFEVMFIFSPTKSQSKLIYRSLATNKFPHVVWFDRNNEFKTNNGFIPKDTRFHTFLLNKQNEIVFVGDPLYNNKLNNLFEKVLDNLMLNEGKLNESLLES